MDEALRLSQGEKTTPVIKIGDEVVVGFDRNKLVDALKKSGFETEEY